MKLGTRGSWEQGGRKQGEREQWAKVGAKSHRVDFLIIC